MDNQMTIFDFLPEDTEVKDFTKMTIEETAAYIGNRLGLTFRWNSFLEHYEAKYKKLKLDLIYSTYITLDEKKRKTIYFLWLWNTYGWSW